MNPNLLSQAAHQHIADLGQAAAARQAAARQAAAPATGRRARIRNRAGWTLVQIGLRLATGSADA